MVARIQRGNTIKGLSDLLADNQESFDAKYVLRQRDLDAIVKDNNKEKAAQMLWDRFDEPELTAEQKFTLIKLFVDDLDQLKKFTFQTRYQISWRFLAKEDPELAKLLFSDAEMREAILNSTDSVERVVDVLVTHREFLGEQFIEENVTLHNADVFQAYEAKIPPSFSNEVGNVEEALKIYEKYRDFICAPLNNQTKFMSWLEKVEPENKKLIESFSNGYQKIIAATADQGRSYLSALNQFASPILKDNGRDVLREWLLHNPIAAKFVCENFQTIEKLADQYRYGQYPAEHPHSVNVATPRNDNEMAEQLKKLAQKYSIGIKYEYGVFEMTHQDGRPTGIKVFSYEGEGYFLVIPNGSAEPIEEKFEVQKLETLLKQNPLPTVKSPVIDKPMPIVTPASVPPSVPRSHDELISEIYSTIERSKINIEGESFVKKYNRQHQRYRYSNDAAIDPNFDSERFAYKATTVKDGFGQNYLAEGPNQNEPEHAAQFLKSLVLNPNAQVTDIIVAGDPKDGRPSRGFLDYFNPDSQDNLNALKAFGVEIVSRKKVDHGNTDNIQDYKVVIRFTDGGRKVEKEILVHHLKNFKDFGTAVFGDDDIKKLVDIRLNAKNKNIATHCSAGLGRTGVIAMAYMAASDPNTFYPAGKADPHAFGNKLTELRKRRAGVVQPTDNDPAGQFKMAISLGQRMQGVKIQKINKLFENNITDPFDVSTLGLKKVIANYNALGKLKSEITIDDIVNFIIAFPDKANVFFKHRPMGQAALAINFRKRLGERPDLLEKLLSAADISLELRHAIDQTQLMATSHFEIGPLSATERVAQERTFALSMQKLQGIARRFAKDNDSFIAECGKKLESALFSQTSDVYTKLQVLLRMKNSIQNPSTFYHDEFNFVQYGYDHFKNISVNGLDEIIISFKQVKLDELINYAVANPESASAILKLCKAELERNPDPLKKLIAEGNQKVLDAVEENGLIGGFKEEFDEARQRPLKIAFVDVDDTMWLTLKDGTKKLNKALLSSLKQFDEIYLFTQRGALVSDRRVTKGQHDKKLSVVRAKLREQGIDPKISTSLEKFHTDKVPGQYYEEVIAEFEEKKATGEATNAYINDKIETEISTVVNNTQMYEKFCDAVLQEAKGRFRNDLRAELVKAFSTHFSKEDFNTQVEAFFGNTNRHNNKPLKMEIIKYLLRNNLAIDPLQSKVDQFDHLSKEIQHQHAGKEINFVVLDNENSILSELNAVNFDKRQPITVLAVKKGPDGEEAALSQEEYDQAFERGFKSSPVERRAKDAKPLPGSNEEYEWAKTELDRLIEEGERDIKRLQQNPRQLLAEHINQINNEALKEFLLDRINNITTFEPLPNNLGEFVKEINDQLNNGMKELDYVKIIQAYFHKDQIFARFAMSHEDGVFKDRDIIHSNKKSSVISPLQQSQPPVPHTGRLNPHK